MAVKNWGYCDLSVCSKFDLNKLDSIEKLGFHTIALNTYIEEADEEPKKKKRKGEQREKQDYFSSPVELADNISSTSKLNILQRVTFEFSDSSITHKMNLSENLKKYDIVAVVPKTLQAFQYACGTMDIDMITFAPESRVPFRISRKLYRQAVDRGIFFELMYSAAIKDSTARKNIINMAHTFYAVGKSRNLIVSSGAENSSLCRGIYDVVNLGFLFGLNSNQSLEVVRDNPRKLILKAEGRKSGKLFVKVRTVSENDVDNKTIEE